MKKLIISTVIAATSLLSHQTFGQENILGNDFDNYLAPNARSQGISQSLNQNYEQNARVYLHAYIDLSHLDPGLLRLIELRMQEAQRQNQIREFWMMFAAGANSASSLLDSNSSLNSRVCDLIKASSIPNPAYELGIKARAPFCYINGYFAKMEKMGVDLNALKKTLLAVKLKTQSMDPDEAESLELYKKVSAAYKELVLASLGKAQTEIEKTFIIDQKLVKNVEDAASDLATYINCHQLISRMGETFICDVKSAPSPVKLDLMDTYKVLYMNKATGVFMPSLMINSLVKAAVTYKNEIRPTDILVDYFVDNLKKALSELDYRTQIQQQKIISLVKREVADSIESSEAASIVALRKLLNQEIQEKLIADLFAFKITMEDYALFSGTKFDQKLLEKLSSQYQEVLNLYGAISVKVEIPNKDILVDLGQGIELLTLKMPYLSLGPVYLLGKNQKQVNDLIDFLSLSL